MRQLKIGNSITNRTEDSLSRYLTEIAHIDLLQQDEEAQLAMKAKSGDLQALDQLIRTNLRFVVSVAKQYQNKGMGLPDLISEGNLGLIKAAHQFDVTKGFKFISFAVYWVRQSIIQAISDQRRVVRLPGNQISDMNRISKAALKLEQVLERMPALSELAELLELPEEKIAEVLSNAGGSVSVDTQSHPNIESSLLDTLINQNSLSPGDQLIKESLTIDLIRVLNRLPKKQHLILKYFYGIDSFPQLSYEDIGLRVKLTSERVRQLKHIAVETLKKLCEVNSTADYFNINQM